MSENRREHRYGENFKKQSLPPWVVSARCQVWMQITSYCRLYQNVLASNRWGWNSAILFDLRMVCIHIISWMRKQLQPYLWARNEGKFIKDGLRRRKIKSLKSFDPGHCSCRSLLPYVNSRR